MPTAALRSLSVPDATAATNVDRTKLEAYARQAVRARSVRVVGGAMLITLFQCLRGNVNLLAVGPWEQLMESSMGVVRSMGSPERRSRLPTRMSPPPRARPK